MKTEAHSESRWVKSARALKEYFERKLKIRMEFLEQAPQERLDGDVQFNLMASSFGIWGLRPAVALKPEDRVEIEDTFSTILDSIARMETQLDDLNRLHAKLEANLEEVPSNVIPLRRTKTVTALSSVTDKRWILKLDCLIESRFSADIHKMAVELHSQSQRYAFLEYRDLAKDKRMNVGELLQLGAITLFVPSLLDLTQAEQETLLSLTSEATVNRPLLMVGAPIPYAELRCEPHVNLDLLAVLSRTYIKLSRSFEEYKQQGLIHYFLDSLSESPT